MQTLQYLGRIVTVFVLSEGIPSGIASGVVWDDT